MQQTKRHTRERRSQHTRPQWRSQIHSEPARECAGHHDAFDAQVQNPGALAQQNAERSQNQWRGDAQHGNPKCRVPEDVDQLGHRHFNRYCVNSVATNTEINDAATMTSAM